MGGCLVDIEASYDIRVDNGPQYFYLVVQHLQTRFAVVTEIHYLDSAGFLCMDVHALVDDAAETST